MRLPSVLFVCLSACLWLLGWSRNNSPPASLYGVAGPRRSHAAHLPPSFPSEVPQLRRGMPGWTGGRALQCGCGTDGHIHCIGLLAGSGEDRGHGGCATLCERNETTESQHDTDSRMSFSCSSSSSSSNSIVVYCKGKKGKGVDLYSASRVITSNALFITNQSRTATVTTCSLQHSGRLGNPSQLY